MITNVIKFSIHIIMHNNDYFTSGRRANQKDQEDSYNVQYTCGYRVLVECVYKKTEEILCC